MLCDHSKDEVRTAAKRQNNTMQNSGVGAESEFDDIIEQLFAKQFHMPNSTKWKLPDSNTMLVHAKWEVSDCVVAFSFFIFLTSLFLQTRNIVVPIIILIRFGNFYSKKRIVLLYV